MIRKAISAIALVALATPASAGWQATKWGMTPKQVVKAGAGKARLDPGTPGDRVQDGSEIGAVGIYTSGKWQFRSVFHFIDNKLSHVRLYLQSGPGGCDLLWEDMESAYGAPLKRWGGRGSLFGIWHDSKNNNKVELAGIADICHLIYEPLKSA